MFDVAKSLNAWANCSQSDLSFDRMTRKQIMALKVPGFEQEFHQTSHLEIKDIHTGETSLLAACKCALKRNKHASREQKLSTMMGRQLLIF